jgi:hypothetical protein
MTSGEAPGTNAKGRRVFRQQGRGSEEERVGTEMMEKKDGAEAIAIVAISLTRFDSSHDTPSLLVWTLLDASNKDVSFMKNKAWKCHQICRPRERVCDRAMFERFRNAIGEKECFFRISFWQNRVTFFKQLFLILLCFGLKTTEQEFSTT